MELSLDLETKRLEHEGWPPECVASFDKFRSRVSLLYPLLGRKVRTPRGKGILRQAFSSGVEVELYEAGKQSFGRKKEMRRPVVVCEVEEVRPAP